MPPEPKPHVSHWIAWSVIALVAGIVTFGTWYYWNQINTIYDNSIVATIKPAQKTTTPAATIATTSATADWKTYTNATYNYSIKYPTSWTAARATSIDVQTDVVKDMRINFKEDSTLKLTINTEAKTKFSGMTLAQFAADYVTPKDKSTVSGGKTSKIGSIDGYQESVAFTDPVSNEIWYFTQNDTYYFAFLSNESVQSNDTKNILSTFQFTK